MDVFYDGGQTLFYLVVIGLSLLGFLALILVIGMDRKQKEKEMEMKYQQSIPSKKIPNKEKNDEILNTLEFMLQNNIIDHNEYNKLIVKCLPFME